MTDPTHACPTCRDAAERGRVRCIDGSDAEIELADGRRMRVAIELVPAVAVGDVVLVHHGIAIARLADEVA